MPDKSEPLLRLRINVHHPVPGVTLRMQRGRDQLVEPVGTTRDRMIFEFTVRAGVRNGRPNFLGDFTQGPADARFVYVNAGTSAGQHNTPWSRRAKIPLTGLSRKLIDAALRTDGVLAVDIEGTHRDGGPCCATVEPLGDGWRLEAK
jgi:hypothetical protein